ncbi:MAG: helicase-associated domain-containing protein [Acidimicrobiales bacterium]
MTLASELSSWSDARLAELLEERPDLAKPAPTTFATLAERAAGWQSSKAHMEAADAATRQLMEALVLLEPPVTLQALASFLGCPDEMRGALRDGIGRLESQAFVVRRGAALYPFVAVAPQSFAAGIGLPAARLFGSLPTSELSSITKRLGLRSARAKADLVTSIVSFLSDGDAVNKLVRSAPKASAELAREVAAGGPLARSPSVDGYGYGNKTVLPGTWLVEHGLAVRATWDLIMMPREVSLALRGGVPFPALRLTPERLDEVDIGPTAGEGPGDGAVSLVRDLSRLLDTWGSDAPPLLKAGGIGTREVRKAAATMGRSERDAARAVELARVAGLVGIDGQSRTARPTAAYDEWRALRYAGRWAWLAGSWLDAPYDISGAGAIAAGGGGSGRPVPPLSAQPADNQASPRRHGVLAGLSGIGGGTAASAASVASVASWHAPAAFAGHTAATAGTGDAAGAAGTALAVTEEAAMLGLCVLHPLPPGAGAPGGGKDGFPGSASSTAVTLTGPGRALLAGEREAGGPGSRAPGSRAPGSTGGWDLDAAMAEIGEHAPAATSELIMQADLTAVAAGELEWEVRRELELIADLESEGAASVYRFTEASLRRGLDAGRSAEAMATFLEAHASRGLPQTLTYLLADLGRRHGRIRVGSASSYLRSDDAALLAEIAHSKRLAKLGFRQLGPNVLACDSDEETLLSALRAEGRLPAREGSDGALVPTLREELRAPRSTIREARLPGITGPRGSANEKTEDKAAGIIAGLRKQPVAPVAQPATGASAPAGRSGRARMTDHPGGAGRATVSAPGGGPPDEPATGGGEERPAQIVRSTFEVTKMLRQACNANWVVRLSYTTRKGQARQATVFPVAATTSQVLVLRFPDITQLTIPYESIEWARVLTEEEEEVLID